MDGRSSVHVPVMGSHQVRFPPSEKSWISVRASGRPVLPERRLGPSLADRHGSVRLAAGPGWRKAGRLKSTES